MLRAAAILAIEVIILAFDTCSKARRHRAVDLIEGMLPQCKDNLATLLQGMRFTIMRGYD